MMTVYTDPPVIMPYSCNIKITEEAARRLYGRGHNPLSIVSSYWQRCQEESKVPFYVGGGLSVWLTYNVTHHTFTIYTRNQS